MAEARTFDPPKHSTAPERAPTDEELKAILSGTGAKTTDAGAHYEQAGNKSPFRFRGRWPRLGVSESLPRRDPVVGVGLRRHRFNLASMDWYVADPSNSTDEEKERTQWVRDTFASFDSGMTGLIERIDYRAQHGTCAFEKVWEIEENSLAWRLEDLVWLHPFTFCGFVLLESKFLLGLLTRSEKGLVFLKYPEKMAIFPHGFTGRNYEGDGGVLRPLEDYVDLKQEMWTNHAASCRMAGEGILKVTVEGGKQSDSWNAADDIIENFEQTERKAYKTGGDVQVDVEFPSGDIPDIGPRVQSVDHQLRAGLDEGLQEFGQSGAGSRALGSELRAASHMALTGEGQGLAAAIQHQLIYDMYWRRGWDYTRAGVMSVRAPKQTNYESIAAGRSLLEAVRDETIPAEDVDKVLGRAYELFGIG
jgi:hypothetical protein